VVAGHGSRNVSIEKYVVDNVMIHLYGSYTGIV